jgi:hypothetical protein
MLNLASSSMLYLSNCYNCSMWEAVDHAHRHATSIVADTQELLLLVITVPVSACELDAGTLARERGEGPRLNRRGGGEGAEVQ